MARQTLRDLFDELAGLDATFLIHDDGFRRHRRSYADTARAARGFARRLEVAGVAPGDRVIIWGENRPEWVVALWGTLIRGAVAVPLDFRSSWPFVLRVAGIVEARVWVAGDELLPAGEAPAGAVIWRLAELSWLDDGPMPAVRMEPDDPAEIIFTSGATADPKGVVLTHRNILANINPIDAELAKYRRVGRPFFPLRILNLLPLSHMFGQTMAAFVPPLLPGTACFMSSYNPADIARAIRQSRVTVLVCVPRMLDVLRTWVSHAAPSARQPSPLTRHWLLRWWRHADVHRLFGLKFWCAVVGAAPLDRDLEEFWSRLGFLVIQGYGLTETAPVVALNHPRRARRGSVGTPLPGVEVKLAPDGEILVRGDNVTRGYYNDPDATAAAFEDGWLRTGDIGELDASGHLHVRGRKKEVIVAPDGTNVFPADIERVLDAVPGVRESAVVGLQAGAQETVHAVAVLEPGADLDQVIAQANRTLAQHQRIRSAARWPGPALPRTDGTRKLRRVAIRRWAAGAAGVDPPEAPGDRLRTLVEHFAPGRGVADETSLDELGLGSLDRVELMVALEHRFHTQMDERAFAAARSVGDLRRLVEDDGAPSGAAGADADLPRWNTRLAARLVRPLFVEGIAVLIARVFAPTRVNGLEYLERLDGPAIFAANHQSHLDAPVIFAALPWSRRYRLAPAMLKEHFTAHFHPDTHPWLVRWRTRLKYVLAALTFAAFPLPQRDTGSRAALRHMGWLASQGYSILVFPEGIRTDAGELRPFQAGIGMMASRLDLPVVPVRIRGLERVLHKSWNWPRRGKTDVAFGPPIRLAGDDYAALAAEVERAVRSL